MSPSTRRCMGNFSIRLRKRLDGEYVFCGRYRKSCQGHQKRFYAAVARAGIEDFRFHDLRHTFGSHLVMEGVDLRTVQQLMGHKDVKMTMRYSHLSPEYVQEAMERLDRLWTPYGHQEVGRRAELYKNIINSRARGWRNWQTRWT